MSRGGPAPVVEGTVEALTHDGKGIVAGAGKKVFVTGALPGERVRYQRIRRRRNFDEARLVEVIEPDPGRQDPRCPVFGICGGCAMQHMTPARQIAHKNRVLADNLARIGGLADVTLAEPLTGPAWHYRRRARLGVKYVHAKERVLVGFRERAKPYVTDMQACPVLDRAAVDLPGALAHLIGGLSVRTELPQVEVAIGDNAKALVFRVLRTPSGDDLEALADFERQSGFRVLLQPGGLASVVPLARFAGEYAAGTAAPLHYRVEAEDLTLEFEPTDFIQINREVNLALIELALRLLAPRAGDRVLDLFSGIGNFSLPLARRCAHVLGVEGVAALTERARDNAARNGLDNTGFVTADLERLAGDERWLAERWDRVLLDPARAGAAAVLPYVARMQPARIVYVSCHPATLARDVGVLVREHGYRLGYAGVIDMFPHTAHVESIVQLDHD